MRWERERRAGHPPAGWLDAPAWLSQALGVLDDCAAWAAWERAHERQG